MSAILVSYVKLSSLVDGTLRIVFDVEPTEAAKFFPPPAPGASFGLARIDENAAQTAALKQEDRRRWQDMRLSQQAGIRCGEPEFWRFLSKQTGIEVTDANMAAGYVRDICNVESRKHLDTVKIAAERWHGLDAAYREWVAP